MFDFEWHVDTAGYEWVREPAGRTLLTGGDRGGWRLRRRGGSLHSVRPLDRPDLARRFARLPLGRDAARDFADEWGVLDDGAGERFSVISARRRRLAAIFLQLDKTPRGGWIGGAQLAAGAFGLLQQPPLRLHLGESPRPHLAVAPTTLWGALLLLTAQDIAGTVTIAACLNCGGPIAVGPGGGATRRRKFCSDPCRGAWHHRRPSKED